MTTMEQEIEMANKIKTHYECDIIINTTTPYTLYCAQDIGKILALSNIRNSLAHIDKVYIIKETNGGNQKRAYISYNNLLKLITKSRKPQAIRFAEIINIDTLTKYCVSIETDILQCILTTFDANIMKTQYKVDNYIIDLYFPEYLLAIECDEGHHSHPVNKMNDVIRQQYIMQKLGCRFIRFNPHTKDFNVFKLLNDIYIHLTVWRNHRYSVDIHENNI